METIPPARENAPPVRYSFAAVFSAACLYDLVLGTRVASFFLLSMGLYEGVSGRVPLSGPWDNTTAYAKGALVMVLVVGAIFAAARCGRAVSGQSARIAEA